MGRPSLYACFLRYLATNAYPIPVDILERDPVLPPAEDERVRKVLIQIYCVFRRKSATVPGLIRPRFRAKSSHHSDVRLPKTPST